MKRWACSGCGYYLEAGVPPQRCPSCSRDCGFLDATCYIPDCGGEGRSDPRIVAPPGREKSEK